MFTVEVPKVKNVSILKDLIKEKRPVRFANIDATDIELWKVSFPIDDLASKQPPTLGPSLRPHRLLSNLFSFGLDVSHIHIAARVPGTGCVILASTIFLSCSIKVHRLLVPRSHHLH